MGEGMKKPKSSHRIHYLFWMGNASLHRDKAGLLQFLKFASLLLDRFNEVVHLLEEMSEKAKLFQQLWK